MEQDDFLRTGPRMWSSATVTNGAWGAGSAHSSLRSAFYDARVTEAIVGREPNGPHGSRRNTSPTGNKAGQGSLKFCQSNPPTGCEALAFA